MGVAVLGAVWHRAAALVLGVARADLDLRGLLNSGRIRFLSMIQRVTETIWHGLVGVGHRYGAVMAMLFSLFPVKGVVSSLPTISVTFELLVPLVLLLVVLFDHI